MDDTDTRAYIVNEKDGVYQVTDRDGCLIMECRDRMSAQHYVELLSRAWRAGFKSGYRRGKA